MWNKGITKGIVIMVAAAGVFYFSMRSHEFLLDFLTVAIPDAIADSECIHSLANSDNTPHIATIALGGAFRMAFKTALFLSTLTVIILINARVGLSFIVGAGLAYVMVRYGIVPIGNKEAIFQIEKYVNFIIAFMFLTGTLFGLIYHVSKYQKNRYRS